MGHQYRESVDLNIAKATLQHFDEIELQPQQRGAQVEADALISEGPAFAVMRKGEVLAIAGIVPMWWEGRFYAWSLLSVHAGPHLLRLTRMIRRYLDSFPYRRIEMTVDADFSQGERWALALGFEREGLLRRYSPRGEDCWMYSRVR